MADRCGKYRERSGISASDHRSVAAELCQCSKRIFTTFLLWRNALLQYAAGCMEMEFRSWIRTWESIWTGSEYSGRNMGCRGCKREDLLRDRRLWKRRETEGAICVWRRLPESKASDRSNQTGYDSCNGRWKCVPAVGGSGERNIYVEESWDLRRSSCVERRVLSADS